MNKRRKPHPSHEAIMNHPGYIGKNGRIVKPRTTRSRALPPPYVASQDPMGAGEFGPQFNPGYGGPEGW